MDANGNATGQWEDVFTDGTGKIHVEADCLKILPPRNLAIVGGIITKGNFNEEDYSSMRAIIKVADNGNSMHDSNDHVTSSHIYSDNNFNCDISPRINIEMMNITKGQVIVK